MDRDWTDAQAIPPDRAIGRPAAPGTWQAGGATPRGSSMTPRPQRFSMIRSFALADLFTLGNAACGMGAVLATVEYVASRDPHFMWIAFALLPVALVLDILDGTVA